MDTNDAPSGVGSAGTLRLGATLAAVGGLATFATTSNLLASESASFYNVSAVIASAIVLIVNLYTTMASRSGRQVAIWQGVQVLALGVISSYLSEPSAFGGKLLAALGVVLLMRAGVVTTTSAGFGIMGVLSLADAIVGFASGGLPIGSALANITVATGGFALLYFAFYDEIASLRVKLKRLESTTKRSQEERDSIASRLTNARAELDEISSAALESERRVRLLEEELTRLEAERSGEPPSDLSTFQFTERELDVLRKLIMTRGSNRIIGEELGIHERTVKSFVYRIGKKTGITSRVELIDRFRDHFQES